MDANECILRAIFAVDAGERAEASEMLSLYANLPRSRRTVEFDTIASNLRATLARTVSPGRA